MLRDVQKKFIIMISLPKKLRPIIIIFDKAIVTRIWYLVSEKKNPK